MTGMSNIALICVTHDPKGKSINLVKSLSPILNDIYADKFIAVSEETDKDLISESAKNTGKDFKTKI